MKWGGGGLCTTLALPPSPPLPSQSPSRSLPPLPFTLSLPLSLSHTNQLHLDDKELQNALDCLEAGALGTIQEGKELTQQTLDSLVQDTISRARKLSGSKGDQDVDSEDSDSDSSGDDSPSSGGEAATVARATGEGDVAVVVEGKTEPVKPIFKAVGELLEAGEKTKSIGQTSADAGTSAISGSLSGKRSTEVPSGKGKMESLVIKDQGASLVTKKVSATESRATARDSLTPKGGGGGVAVERERDKSTSKAAETKSASTALSRKDVSVLPTSAVSKASDTRSHSEATSSKTNSVVPQAKAPSSAPGVSSTTTTTTKPEVIVIPDTDTAEIIEIPDMDDTTDSEDDEDGANLPVMKKQLVQKNTIQIKIKKNSENATQEQTTAMPAPRQQGWTKVNPKPSAGSDRSAASRSSTKGGRGVSGQSQSGGNKRQTRRRSRSDSESRRKAGKKRSRHSRSRSRHRSRSSSRRRHSRRGSR